MSTRSAARARGSAPFGLNAQTFERASRASSGAASAPETIRLPRKRFFGCPVRLVRRLHAEAPPALPGLLLDVPKWRAGLLRRAPRLWSRPWQPFYPSFGFAFWLLLDPVPPHYQANSPRLSWPRQRRPGLCRDPRCAAARRGRSQRSIEKGSPENTAARPRRRAYLVKRQTSIMMHEPGEFSSAACVGQRRGSTEVHGALTGAPGIHLHA